MNIPSLPQFTSVSMQKLNSNSHPRVASFGYNITMPNVYSMFEEFGIQMILTADLEAGYRVPYFNDRQYLAFAPAADLLLGSKNWFEIRLFFMRFITFVEIVGLKFSPRTKLAYDVVSYLDACFSMGFDASAIEMNAEIQFDFLDCNIGLFGTIFVIIFFFF
jgi:hypothetical protein